MANIRIKDQTTDTALAAGDYVIVDNETEGTRKFDLGQKLVDIDDDITDVKSDLNYLGNEGATLYSITWEHGGIDNANGNNNNEGSLTRTRTPNYYPITDFSKVENNTTGNLFAILYTLSNGVYTFREYVQVNPNASVNITELGKHFYINDYVRFDVRASLESVTDNVRIYSAVSDLVNNSINNSGIINEYAEDVNITWEQGTFSNATGLPGSNTRRIRTRDFIPLNKYDVLFVETAPCHFVEIYKWDTHNNYLGTEPMTTKVIYKADEGGYVKLVFRQNPDYDITTDEAQYITVKKYSFYTKEGLPIYTQNVINGVKTQLNNLQKENTSTLSFITDMHVKAFDQNTARSFSVAKRIAKSLSEINKTNMIDFNVLGGDYLWNNANSTKSMAITAFSYLQSLFYPFRDKIFALQGNHDDNSIALTGTGLNAVVYPDEEYRYIGKQYERSGTVYNVGDHNFYGYYDIPSQKIRVIFVNTVDIPYEISGSTLVYNGQHMTAISEEQNLFIQNALKFNESGWNVIFMSHHGLNNAFSNAPEDYTNNIWEVIKAYKNKTTYSGTVTNSVGSYSVSVDYTDNKSNGILACISGHTHTDASEVVNNILCISTTTASASLSSTIDGSTVTPTYESETETAFDLFTFDIAENKIYATRYGLGNDREWTVPS